MKITAAPLVTLVKKLPAPRLPKTVLLAPPPKTAPISAPLPRCNRTTPMSSCEPYWVVARWEDCSSRALTSPTRKVEPVTRAGRGDESSSADVRESWIVAGG